MYSSFFTPHLLLIFGTYLKPCQTSKMKYLVKIVKLLTISVKSSLLDVWQGSEYASSSRNNFLSF